MALTQKILDYAQSFDHIIWDWNGTLMDDVEVAVASMNDLLLSHGMPTITPVAYRKLFGFPVQEFYSNLGFKFDKVSFAETCNQFMAGYERHRIAHGRLFNGADQLLNEFYKTKTSQSILSAAEQIHLNEMTDRFEISKYFHFRYGIENNQAASKVSRGIELLQIANMDKQKTLMIGDTDHDFEVASEMGISCLILADGHQEECRLTHLSAPIFQGRRHYI